MGLQAQQIVTLACQQAKCSGFTSQAGQLLNMILQELCQTYDFDVARTSYTFNLVGGTSTYTMPADYLRALNNDVFFTVNGVPNRMTYAAPDEFDILIQQPGFTGYPTRFTTDMAASPPTMSVWPPPNGVYPVSFRYFRQMPDITTPEASTTVPWFPNSNYLVTRLAGELMKITDDDRADKFLGDSPDGAQGILSRYLKLKDDGEARIKTVTLDPRHFGRAASGLKSTKTVGF